MRHEADVRLVNAKPARMTANPEFHSALIGKFIRRTAVSLLFVGVLLFGAAGTLNWRSAFATGVRTSRFVWYSEASSFSDVGFNGLRAT